MEQMSLVDSLTVAQSRFPECLAVGYVDMTKGTLVAMKSSTAHPATVMKLVAEAAEDLFRGKSTPALAGMLQAPASEAPCADHWFRELLVFTEDLVQVFLRVEKLIDYALVFVCRGSADPAVVLAQSRLAMFSLEAAL